LFPSHDQEQDAIVDQANEMLENYKQEIVKRIQALDPRNQGEANKIRNLHDILVREKQ